MIVGADWLDVEWSKNERYISGFSFFNVRLHHPPHFDFGKKIQVSTKRDITTWKLLAN